jgi:hypothetical protein
MQGFLELIGKVPEWAVKIAFVLLVLIVTDMYLRSTKAFWFRAPSPRRRAATPTH